VETDPRGQRSGGKTGRRWRLHPQSAIGGGPAAEQRKGVGVREKETKKPQEDAVAKTGAGKKKKSERGRKTIKNESGERGQKFKKKRAGNGLGREEKGPWEGGKDTSILPKNVSPRQKGRF